MGLSARCVSNAIRMVRELSCLFKAQFELAFLSPFRKNDVDFGENDVDFWENDVTFGEKVRHFLEK
ncbi:hypothetical protein EZS27_016251 [termite gut metagenome]|uniref:Uncharacterized protein n=1 Tax=termite gut metagenome TaxID=433724 RepID=A0A5J4RQY1_9ZZZZ